MYSKRTYKILIVEDNEDYRRNFTEKFLAAGAEEGIEAENILTAADAAEAYELYNRHVEDIRMLVTDIKMPGRSGLELCREIRQLETEYMKDGLVGRKIPIVVMTAYDSDKNQIESYSNQAMFIAKEQGINMVVQFILGQIRFFTPVETVHRGSLVIKETENLIYIGDYAIPMTGKMLKILKYLVENADVAVDRNRLMEISKSESEIEDEDADSGDTRKIDTLIKRIRKEVNAYDHPDWNIETVRNVGYRFSVKS